MALVHDKWTASGQVLKETDLANQYVWKSAYGEVNVNNGDGTFSPYVLDGSMVNYGSKRQVDFDAGSQSIKQGTKTIIKSSRFFVQRFNDTTNRWVTIPHGLPARESLHNAPSEGKVTQRLTFPNAPYSLTLDMEFGRSEYVVFGVTFNAKQSARLRFQWVHTGINSDFEMIQATKSVEKVDTGTRTVGVRLKDLEFRWTWEEALDRKIDFMAETDGSNTLTINFGPFDYVANEVLTVKPDSWGPAQVASNEDDCQEADDTTVDLDGWDSDGSWIGNRAGVSYDCAWRWDSCPLASGDTVDACTVEAYLTWYVGSPLAIVQGVEEADPANWATTRPSQRTQTAATVTWDPPTGVDAWKTSPELKTIVQEICDDTSRVANDAIALIWKDNASATDARVQYQLYNNSATDAAKISITYNTSGVGRIMSSLAAHGGLANYGGIAGRGGGLAG